MVPTTNRLTTADPTRRATRPAWVFATLATGALVLAATFAAPAPASAGPCEKSARLARRACGFDAKDDLWETRAICAHVSRAGARQDCLDEAEEGFEETIEECRAVHSARLGYCATSGEDYYDPPFGSGMFTSIFQNQNPYWLLSPGNRWVFEGDGETIVVEVLPATKRIGRVNCIVVNDVVSDEDGELIEDTDDWYAQAHNGDVYYCGENAKDYEYFRGDDPEEAELVAIDGSFKHGVEGAKAGVAMFRSPTVGRVYRQEFSLGNAEDGAEVLSTSYSYGDGSGLDSGVPQGLANLLCNGDCVVTREFNLIEPGPEALKYYAPGIGVFLEVEDGEAVRLVSCNVDSRCGQL